MGRPLDEAPERVEPLGQRLRGSPERPFQVAEPPRLLAATALGVVAGRYSVAGLEGTTMLSFRVAAGVAVGFALAATGED